MNGAGMVLADTSVWVRYFRDGQGAEAKVLSDLLTADRVVLCGPVMVEILSGTKDHARYEMLSELLSALPLLEPGPGVWEKLAAARFALARRGVQQSLVDLWIALVAHDHDACVWTLDRDVDRIARVIPFKTFMK